MAGTKTPSELLKSFKQYNKEAREKKAIKEGFADATHYITYLESIITGTYSGLTPILPPKSGTSKKPTSRPTIHIVDVLDASGSMSGGKFTAALKGINEGLSALLKDTAAVNYTHSLCDFSDDIRIPFVKRNRGSFAYYESITRGSTSLFDAIGETIEQINVDLKSTDKVLINIYTDGQENSSRKYNRTQISSLIRDLSKVGWTFTFIGTAVDTKFATDNLNMDESNSLVYDGTAEGLAKSFVTNSLARSAYGAKVAAGEDVSLGFYKDIN